MTKEQIINDFVTSQVTTSNVQVSRDYIANLVNVAITGGGCVSHSAIDELYRLLGYKNIIAMQNKIAMLRMMIEK